MTKPELPQRQIINQTSFSYGPRITSRMPPQREMVLCVKGTFDLVHDGVATVAAGFNHLTGEQFHDDDLTMDGDLTHPGDLALFKPNAEVLLMGTCHPHAGGPVTVCNVGFRVGEWRKELMVVGPRVWRRKMLLRNVISEPVPFETMPLTWREAFGGTGHAGNPVGKGHDSVELPMVEYPDVMISSRGDAPPPAGFGPINSKWQPRAGRTGTYDQKYMAERWPFFPADFDWTYFNNAPADQQVEGYLQGDEEIELLHLHPAQESLTTRLPGVRVRAFVRNSEGEFSEVPMNLDTLSVFPDKNQLTLVWRGLTKVADEDFEDIRHTLIVSELLDEEPKPASHYEEQMPPFEPPPPPPEAGPTDEAPPADPAADPVLKDPEKSPFQAKKMAGIEEGAVESPVGDDPISKHLDAKIKEVQAQSPKLSHPQIAEAQGALKDKMNMLRQEWAKRGVNMDQYLEGALANAQAAPPLTPSAAMAQALQMKLSLEAAGIQHPKLADLDKLANDPRMKQLDPRYRAPRVTKPKMELPKVPKPETDEQGNIKPLKAEDPKPPDAKDAPKDEEKKEEKPAGGGKDYREQELEGEDFSNQDLSGADFTGAVLTGATFAGATLTGAIFEEAICQRVSFVGAKLNDANLSTSDLWRADFTDADLTGASITRTEAMQATFRGATLTDADVELTTFANSDLRDVTAKGLKGKQVEFDKADLTGATLDGAVLPDVSLVDARATGASFCDADLSRGKLSGKGADFSKVTFHRIQAKGSSWQHANLEGAEFVDADLRESYLAEIRGAGVTFLTTDLRTAKLRKADLTGARFVGSNLFQVDFEKSTLTGADMTKANCYMAAFYGAKLEEVSFLGANVQRTLVETQES